MEILNICLSQKDLFIGWVSFDIRSLKFDKQIDFWSNIRQGNDSPGGGKLHYKLVVRKDISVAPIVPDVNLHLLNRKSKKEKDDLDIDSFVMIPNPSRTISNSEQLQRSNHDINMNNVALEITSLCYYF